MDIVKHLLSDQFMFLFFQGVFVILAIYAGIKDNFPRNTGGKSGASLTVQHGNESWAKFNLAYGVIALVILEAINTTEALKGYKTVVTALDLSLLFYLCFFNRWFREWTLQVINNSQQMKDSS